MIENKHVKIVYTYDVPTTNRHLSLTFFVFMLHNSSDLNVSSTKILFKNAKI